MLCASAEEKLMLIKRTFAIMTLMMTALVVVACAAPVPRSSMAPDSADAAAQGAPVALVADCSACARTPCTIMAGRSFCAEPVDAQSSSELEAHLDRVVSLRAAELRAGGGPCTLIGCACCNECAGGSMLFRPSVGATFQRGEREVTFAIRPLRDREPLACAAYRDCQQPECALMPGKYDAVGTLRSSDMGWDLELLAIQPSIP